MSKAFRVVFGAIGVLAVIFGVSYFAYFNTAFFAPRYEAVRRDTMIQSRAYSEATVRELYRLKRQWDATADPQARATIIAAARHEFSIFPEDRLPADLRAWMTVVMQ